MWTHAVQLDGKLVPYGRRLRDLDGCEALSYVYSIAVEGMDSEKRREFDQSLRPDEVIAEELDWLPEALKGERPPSWWRG